MYQCRRGLHWDQTEAIRNGVKVSDLQLDDKDEYSNVKYRRGGGDPESNKETVHYRMCKTSKLSGGDLSQMGGNI